MNYPNFAYSPNSGLRGGRKTRKGKMRKGGSIQKTGKIIKNNSHSSTKRTKQSIESIKNIARSPPKYLGNNIYV